MRYCSELWTKQDFSYLGKYRQSLFSDTEQSRWLFFMAVAGLLNSLFAIEINFEEGVGGLLGPGAVIAVSRTFYS